MVWDSAPKEEFASVRNFTLQKKLAVIAAHNSVLAAWVKQTRDTNRKRQVKPFPQGDLVYISIKNLMSPKGLAWKLIPKYIGPYRISKDFGNHLFQVNLPINMRQRGVHNIFHASPLCVHIPNKTIFFQAG